MSKEQTYICEFGGRFTTTVLIKASSRKEAAAKLKAGCDYQEVGTEHVRTNNGKVVGVDKEGEK